MSSKARTARTCDFPGCGRKNRARGLCGTHQAQQLAGKELTPVRERRTSCTHPGCEERHHALGLCDVHYRRSVRNQPMDGPPPAHRKTKSMKSAAGLGNLPPGWFDAPKPPPARRTQDAGGLRHDQLGLVEPLHPDVIDLARECLTRHDVGDLADMLGVA